MKLITRAAISLVLAAVAGSCRGGGGDLKPPPPPTPGSLEAEAATTALARAGLPRLHVVLADPRLARVREAARAKDDAQAAAAMSEARSAAAPLSSEEACGWDYVYGKLCLAADLLPEAQTAFDAVSREESDGGGACPLAGYARLRAAQAYARAGKLDEALARARAVPDYVLPRDEVRAIVGEVLAARGDRVGAMAEWRSLLDAQPRGPRWVETSVRLANALLDRAGADPLVDVEEALSLATHVVLEAPRAAESSGAQAARHRALAWIRAKDPSRGDALSEAERARQAQSYLDTGDVPRAVASAGAIVLHKPRTADDDTLCKAAITRGQAMLRTKTASANAWGDAIVACAKSDALVTASFAGGKASLREHHPEEAAARFGKVEELFPKHRLADDARFQAALLALDAGDEDRFEAMLMSMPKDYPDGDMGPEGLFRVALLRMTKGLWTTAKEPLEQILELTPGDRHWATAGRAAYFLGRIDAALGDVDAARERWTNIVASYPLSFYMTQAFARLAALDAARAKKALEAAIAKDDASTTLYTRDHPELRSVGFARATHLLEVGDVDTARKELAAAGVTGEGVDAELAWTAAYVLNAAGFPEIGHGFWRAKQTEHLAHYPVGRWRIPWEISFPRAFDTVVLAESTKYGLSPALTWGIMREESGFVADAKSSSNAYGLMQLIVPTARVVAKGTGLPHDEGSLKRPEVSVALGTKLLAQLRGSYASNPALAIAAYNGGGGAVGRWVTARGRLDFDLWVETIPFEETRGYIKRVLASEAAYAFLYARPTLDEVLRIPPNVGARPAVTPP